MIQHPIAPIFDENAELLILGSFPSVKSREVMFYYGHPQNRFWKVMAFVCQAPVPQTVKEKTNLLLEHHIALWDVIASCEITGSADSSIKNVVPNAVENMINATKVQRIFVNGKKAKALYDKYLKDKTGIEAVCLPSTSPANAAWSLERLQTEWRQLLMGA